MSDDELEIAPEVLRAVEQLGPAYDYRVNGQRCPLTEEQCKEAKVLAAMLMTRAEQKASGDAPTERVKIVVQLLSLLRVEIPTFLMDTLKLDVDTAISYTQYVFDRMLLGTAGMALSWAGEVADYGAPYLAPNRHLLIFSTPMLALLNAVLCEASGLVFNDDYEDKDDFERLEAIADRYTEIMYDAFMEQDDEMPVFFDDRTAAICERIRAEHMS